MTDSTTVLLLSALLSIVLGSVVYAVLVTSSPHEWWSALTLAALVSATAMIAGGSLANAMRGRL